MDAEQADQAGATSRQSLLDTAHSLHALLATRLASPSASPGTRSISLHPLSAIPHTALPELRAALASTVATLRSGISQFSSLALPQADSATGDGSRDGRARRDRYLTLLRDATGTESSLLTARKDDAVRAKRVLKRRRREYEELWEVTTPRSSVAGGPTVLSVLEELAKDLELVTFRDDEGIDGGRKDGPVTLSVGGKVMVVDFEVVGEMDVARVKVAYVADGQDLHCAVAEEKLHALLRRSGEPKEDESVRQRCWQGVRSLLEQLKELDEATERLGQDCFMALNRTLPEDLNSVFSFPATQAIAEHLQLPLFLPTHTILQALLLWHATPFARLRSTFASFASSAISPFDAFSPPPATSLRQAGIYGLRISLAAIEDDLDAAKADPKIYVATLDPPVPIEAASGRAVCQALGMELRGADEQALNRDTTVQSEGKGLLDLVLPPAGDERPKTEQQTFERTLPASSADPAFTIRFTTARPGSTSQPTFLATHLRFKEARQLRGALKVLEAQVRVNELVKSIALESEAKLSKDGQGDAAAPEAKREKEKSTANGAGKEALQKRVEQALEATGTLSLGLREVVRELRRAVE
ncbi:hypothetical protein JCM10295v2_005193 [Rhodotorula toruloides]